MPTVGERILELRTQRGWTQEQVAEKIDADRSTIGKYETGESTPTYRMLVALAELFGVSLDFLCAVPQRADNASESEVVWLPVYSPVQAGALGRITPEPEGWHPVQAHKVKDGEYAFVRVEGDSMNPPFQSGFLALVRQQSVVDNGDIAVVVVDGDEATTMKQYYQHERAVTLRPTNPNYEPLVLDASRIRIVGKVVAGAFEL